MSWMGGYIWKGEGIDEIGKRVDNFNTVIRVDKNILDLVKLINC